MEVLTLRVILRRLPTSRFLCLGNPMFPERPVTTPKPQILDPKNLPKNLKGGPDEVLAQHGGKLAVVGFSLACFLIYRFFKSGTDRTATEESLHVCSPLEPYESNELRMNNEVSTAQYKSLVSVYSNELAGNAQVSYKDFIVETTKVIDKRLNSPHLLDRVIYSYSGPDNPVGFPVRCTPQERAETLFFLAQNLDHNGKTVSKVLDGVDPSIPSEVVSIASAEAVVTQLLNSWQVPNDKRVFKTDESYPFDVYRNKTASDMIAEYLLHNKVVQEENTLLTYDQFREFILGEYVCAWAECKRGR